MLNSTQEKTSMKCLLQHDSFSISLKASSHECIFDAYVRI